MSCEEGIQIEKQEWVHIKIDKVDLFAINFTTHDGTTISCDKFENPKVKSIGVNQKKKVPFQR